MPSPLFPTPKGDTPWVLRNAIDRLIAAFNALTTLASSKVSSITGTAPIASTGGITPVISLNDAGVTNAKLSNVASGIIKGRATAGTGSLEDLTAAQTKTVLAITTSDVSGLAAIASNGSASSLIAGTVPAAQTPAYIGDVTKTAASLITTLATVNSNVGSFTNASITVNAKGLVTSASSGSNFVSYSAVFSGLSTAADSTTISSGTMFTNASTTINVPTHGMTSGDVCWFQNNSSGVFYNTVYFATVIDSNNIKVSISNAARLAGTFITATANGAGFIQRWTNGTSPRLGPAGCKLSGVDGVSKSWSVSGTYVIHLASAMADTNYQVYGSCQTVTIGTPLLFTLTNDALTTSSVIVQSTDTAGGGTAPTRMSVTIAA